MVTDPLTKSTWPPSWYELALCSALKQYGLGTGASAVCECADCVDCLVFVGGEEVVEAFMADSHEEIFAAVDKMSVVVAKSVRMTQ